MLGAAYSHSALPLIVMLFMGGIIIGVNLMSLEADEFRKINRMAANEIRAYIKQYRNEPRHAKSNKPVKRERVNVKGVTVR